MALTNSIDIDIDIDIDLGLEQAVTSVLATVAEAWQRLMKPARNAASQLSAARASSPGRAAAATRGSTTTWNAGTCSGRASRYVLPNLR